QLASFGGEDQVLFFGDRGLTAVDPVSGKVLWEYGASSGGPGLPRSLQPHPVGKGEILIAGQGDLGTERIDVARAGDTWKPARRWASRGMKPSFNDFVVHQGFLYGFDGGIFCCVDGHKGKRRWKEGRYGYGQVLLLANQSLLLVVSEKGEAVLLAANPER